MTADEVVIWRQYTAKHGAQPTSPRIETVLANIAHLLSVGHGIKSKVTQEPFAASHFVPWMHEAEPISLESAIRTWS